MRSAYDTDGIFGEVLFFILRLTLGDDYDAVAHTGWVKIFSRILRIVVPIAVAYEIANEPAIETLTTKRVSNMTAAVGKGSALKADEKSSSERTTNVSENSLMA